MHERNDVTTLKQRQYLLLPNERGELQSWSILQRAETTLREKNIFLKKKKCKAFLNISKCTSKN